MIRKSLEISYELLNADELDQVQFDLLNSAKAVAKNAYAPYSNFHVGAAVLLSNGRVMVGSNQENASYPVGLCAEGSVLASVGSQFPEEQIVLMAITADFAADAPKGRIFSPCGKCRQMISEYENRQKQEIPILLLDADGAIVRFANVAQLLPFAFNLKA